MRNEKTRALLALDIDRTLLTDDYRVLPEVRDAVQHARAHGIAVALATARGPAGLQVIFDDLGPVDAVISFGGALVLQSLDGFWTRDNRIPEYRLTSELSHRVIVLSRELGLSLALYTANGVFADQVDQNLAEIFRNTREACATADLTGVADPPFKFLAVSNRNHVARLKVLQRTLSPWLSCVFSHANYLEIVGPTVSKGAALQALAAALGVRQEATVAIGDSENDLALLRSAGYPIAMGNAIEAVKRVAAWVTASNAEAGVHRAIAHCARELWGIPAPAHPST